MLDTGSAGVCACWHDTSRIRSARAGLQFDPSKLHPFMANRLSTRVTVDSAVYLAAVLEYLAAEMIEFAGNGVRPLLERLL